MDFSFGNSNPWDFNVNSYGGIPLPPQQPMMSMPQQANPYDTTYPYGFFESRRGYKPPPINDITIRQAAFKFNLNINAWEYEQSNNKGKTTIIPVAQGIAPNGVIYIKEEGKLKWIILIYPVNGEDKADIIPAEDFYKGKVAKHITHIYKIPGCSNKLYNELLCFLVRNSPNAKTLTLYPHQGWNYSGDVGVYVHSPDKTNPLFKLETESVLRRKRVFFAGNWLKYLTTQQLS